MGVVLNRPSEKRMSVLIRRNESGVSGNGIEGGLVDLRCLSTGLADISGDGIEEGRADPSRLSISVIDSVV